MFVWSKNAERIGKLADSGTVTTSPPARELLEREQFQAMRADARAWVAGIERRIEALEAT